MDNYAKAKKVEFTAKGNMKLVSTILPISFTGIYSETENEVVSVNIFPAQRARANRIWERVFDTPLELEGKTEIGEGVWIPTFIATERSVDNSKITGTSNKIVIGDLRKFSKKGSIKFVGYLPRTPLTLSDRSVAFYSDGRIAPTPGSDFEKFVVNWNSIAGKASLADHFHFYEYRTDTPSSLVRLHATAMEIDSPAYPGLTVKEFLRKIDKEIQIDMNLLSFLSLKRLDYYRAEIFTVNKSLGAKTRIFGYDWLGFIPKDQRKTPQSFLPILPIKLRSGLMEVLYKNYREFPRKELLDRSIHYLLASHEQGYRESHLTNVYSAIETLVNGTIDEAGLYLLNKGQFDKLSKSLRKAIREFVMSNSDLETRLIGKLPELRRRSIAERTIYCANGLGLDLSRIWGGNSEFEIREAFKRRNALIHRGIIEDQLVYDYDFYRFRKLSSLILLRLLGCPIEVINDHWIDDLYY